jgi:hypothetical protein
MTIGKVAGMTIGKVAGMTIGKVAGMTIGRMGVRGWWVKTHPTLLSGKTKK